MATITGTNFQPNARVKFGDTYSDNVDVVSTTSILVDPPAHSAGTVDITVENLDGTSATLVGGYTYGDGPPAGYNLWLTPGTLSAGAVASWSNSGHDFVQATGAAKPVKSTGPARVTFDGGDVLTCDDQIVTGAFTFGIAFKFDTIPTGTSDFQTICTFKVGSFRFSIASVPAGGWGNYVFNAQIGGASIAAASTALDTSKHCIIVTWNGSGSTSNANYTMRFDDSLQSLTDIASNLSAGTTGAVGGWGDLAHNLIGNIYDTEMYSGVLAGDDMVNLRAYLMSLIA